MAVGVVILMLGMIIFRIDGITLNAGTTKFLAEQLGNQSEQAVTEAVPTTKTIPIPPWCRFLLLCVGGIMIFHAVGMAKPK
jgi:hypothetical protein